MLRIALKDLFARKRRLVTTAVAIALGIAFLTGTQLLSGILSDSIKSLVGDTYDGIDAVVRSSKVQQVGFGNEIRTPVPEGLAAQVAQVEGVRASSGIVETITAQLVGKDGKIVGSSFGPPTIVYNWVEDAQLRFGTLRDGRGPQTDAEIVLDFGSAKDGGYQIGDTVTVAGQTQTEQFTLVGLTGLGPEGKDSGSTKTLQFTTPVAQRIGQIPGEFSYVVAAAAPGLSQQELTDAISAALPGEQVVTGERFSTENQESISQFVDILGTFVSVFGYIAIFVACFIIYNTFSIIVAQRTRETALLRAVGARRRQVLGATMLEAVLIGLVSSVLGLIFGALLGTGLAKAFSSSFTVKGGIPPIGAGTVVLAFVIGVGVTVVSAVGPALRSTRVPPIAALSEVSVDRSDVSRSRLVWGVVMLVLGGTLMGLGLSDVGPNPLVEVGAAALLILVSVALVLGPLIAAPMSRLLAAPFAAGGRITGRLAGENAARNPKRTAATAAALTIGVTLVTVIAILAASLKASIDSTISSSLKADLVVNTTTFSIGAGIPAEVADQVGATPGVKIASPVRFGPVRLTDAAGKQHARENPEKESLTGGLAGAADTAPAGEDKFMLGVDPATFFEVLDLGELEGSPADMAPGTFATTRKTAEDRGWQLGDKVPMFFARSGEQELTLTVIAQRDIGQSSLYLPMATFEQVVPPGFNIDNAIYVVADSPADVPQVQRSLDRLVADLPTVKVQDLQEYAEQQSGPLNTIVLVIYGLLALAIIIALVGIANTLGLSILERTRELGLLRAVGMTKKQLRRSIRQEAGIVAVFGTLLGLVIGIGFSLALSAVITADNPDIFSYRLPVPTLVAITVIGALAGVLAAILPARRAAKLDVLQAISSV
ncbi:MAG: ABC transporter permease [Actinomycetes bacterium]